VVEEAEQRRAGLEERFAEAKTSKLAALSAVLPRYFDTAGSERMAAHSCALREKALQLEAQLQASEKIRSKLVFIYGIFFK
jgi:hypothetical protein